MVPNMELCSKQRQSLIASFWQNIYNYIYLFIYWFKMIQSATHVRKWLCDIRENSLKAPRFIYGLSKPCMFVFRFRGLSDRHPWEKDIFQCRESTWKIMKVPCMIPCQVSVSFLHSENIWKYHSIPFSNVKKNLILHWFSVPLLSGHLGVCPIFRQGASKMEKIRLIGTA